MLLFLKSFQYPYRFHYQSKIIHVIPPPQKKKRFSCNEFPVIGPNEYIYTI